MSRAALISLQCLPVNLSRGEFEMLAKCQVRVDIISIITRAETTPHRLLLVS